MKEWENLIDEDLEGDIGWISPEGLFFSCDFMGHHDLMLDLQSKIEGCPQYVDDFEAQWVKLTSGICPNKGLFLTMRKRLTPRQKLTITKLILKHDLIVDGYDMYLRKGQSIVREGSQIKFPIRR